MHTANLQEQYTIVNNKRGFAFELSVPEAGTASLTYRWLKGDMLLMQTTVPPALQNTPAPYALIDYVLQHAAHHGLRIRVYCPLVTKYMQQHPEYAGILAT
jgi:predicted GNAT family acetyltransferase